MSRRRRARSKRWCPTSFNPRLLVDEQATCALGQHLREAHVSTHACSLMSRRRRARGARLHRIVSTHACSLMSRRRLRSSDMCGLSCFNPRLLVDEQATRGVGRPAQHLRVSTHACSLMSRRPWSACLAKPAWSFNPRLLVDEQATLTAGCANGVSQFQPTPAR